MKARLFLFDDRRARRWAPLTLTRPVGEILFGCLTIRERAEHVLGIKCEGHLSRKRLIGFDEPGAPPAIAPEDVSGGGTRVLLSSRAIAGFQTVQLPDSHATIFVDGKPAGWIVPDGAPLPSEIWLRDPDAANLDGARVDLAGFFLGHPWDLMRHNAEQISRDVERLWPVASSGEERTEGVHRIGSHPVSMAEDAIMEPGVHLDLRDGPIRVDRRARVEGPARLTGPLYVGPDTIVFGGSVGTSSLGPACRIRGEVADSVFLGFVNKAHDGHIGHAVLGRWVNLGAFTTNSDLKNNYGTVRVWTPEGDKDTGLVKVGCFLGDHVKTGIGTLLNTGTIIGAGSNVFGGLMPPTVVPPFSWGAGSALGEYRLDKFLETSEVVMARRNQRLTPGVRGVLETAWKATARRRNDGPS